MKKNTTKAEDQKKESTKKFRGPAKKMSREELAAANNVVLASLFSHAAKSFENLDKAGKIPAEITGRDGKRQKVDLNGLRAFCKRFSTVHANHMNVLREMNAKSGLKTEVKAKEADVK